MLDRYSRASENTFRSWRSFRTSGGKAASNAPNYCLDTPRAAHLGLVDFIHSIRLCRLPAFMICTPLPGNYS
jgi:hypothetical protein